MAQKNGMCIVCFKPISEQECEAYQRETGDSECPNLCESCASQQARNEDQEGVNPLTSWSYMLAFKNASRTFLGQSSSGGGSSGGGGDIHPGDRVKVTEAADGLEQDASGVCEEVQGKSIKVKLDGEPIPRWCLKTLFSQEKSKEDILKGDQEGQGGGLEALMGG